MSTVTAGQSATITIPAGTPWRVTTTGEGLVKLLSGGAGAGFTSWRVTPGDPAEIGPFNVDAQISVLCVSGVTTDGQEAAVGLTSAQAAALAGIAVANGSPQTLTFAGSPTTAVPAATSASPSVAAGCTVEVTANTGVTNLVAQVQATTDGSTWTTIGTLTLTAPGTGKLPVSLPYYGLRVNVTALAGGTASALVRNGVTPLAAGAGTAVVNPSLTGVPAPGPYTLAVTGVPVIQPPSGSVAANGALTLGVALLEVFSGGSWMYFPAGAVYAGSAAGLYWTVMSSTTVGTIYNNTLPAGTSPSVVPIAPTAIVAAGPGAYTGTASFGTSGMFGISMPGGSMGPNGTLEFLVQVMCPNNASVKTFAVSLGTTQIGNITVTNSRFGGIRRTLRNRGSQSAQIVAPVSGSGFLDGTLDGGAGPFAFTVDTSQPQNVNFTPFYSTAGTDFIVFTAISLVVTPGA